MGAKKSDVGAKSAVGDELAAVLPDVAWYKRSHLLKLNFVIASLTLFCKCARRRSLQAKIPFTDDDCCPASANGYDGSLMNGLQALHQWESFFDTPAGAWLGFFNAIYWVGTGVSYPLAAIVANKYGRLTGVYIGYAFLALGAGLQAGANGDVAFVLARLFVGCASAWFGNCVPLLINEIAYPSHRGICNALFMCGWVGPMLHPLRLTC